MSIVSPRRNWNQNHSPKSKFLKGCRRLPSDNGNSTRRLTARSLELSAAYFQPASSVFLSQ
jgi:hypothetical protein